MAISKGVGASTAVIVAILLSLVQCQRTNRFEAIVRVDFGTTLQTGDVSRFSRRKFINGHGNFKPSAKIPEEMLDYLTEDLKVSFSRSSAGPFRGGNFPQRTTTAQIQKDGEQDLFLKTCKECNRYRLRFVSDERIVTDSPFLIPELTKDTATERAAAKYAGRYFKHFFTEDDRFPKPKYYECYNEPMAKAKDLKRKGESEFEFVSRISQFCSDICTEVVKENPDVMVGGPAAAFTRPYFKEFDHFNSRMRNWMDVAAKTKCQTFVSEHLYNIGGTVADANMDLIESYSAWLSPDRKPQKYLVSEMGQYVSVWFRKSGSAMSPLPARDFSIMHEAMRVLMSMMRVPDNVLQVVTFINLETMADRDITNGNRYPWSLIEEKSNGRVEWSPLIRYFEILEGLDGDFVYSSSDNMDISVHAVATKEEGYIIMQNIGTRNVTVTLNFPYGKDRLQSYERRRLGIIQRERTKAERAQSLRFGGDILWDTERVDANPGFTNQLPDEIMVEEDEITILKVVFDVPSRDNRRVQRSRHYPASIRDHAGKEPDFPAPIRKNRKIDYFFEDVPSTPGGMVDIRISHSRKFGLSEKPKVFVNNVEVPQEDFSDDVAGGFKLFDENFYGVFLVHYHLEDLTSRTRPKISVEYPDDGGLMVTVVLEVTECTRSSCCVLQHRKNQEPCNIPTGDVFTGRIRPDPTPVAEPTPTPSPRPENVSKQMLVDPNFEAGPSSSNSWSRTGSAKKQTHTKYGGNRAMELPLGEAEISQNLYLVRGRRYRLRCYIRGRVKMSISDSAGAVVVGEDEAFDISSSTDSAWDRAAQIIDIRKTGTHKISIRTKAQNSGFVDSCDLFRIEKLPPRTPSPTPTPTPMPQIVGDQIFDSPGFESTSNPWDRSNGASYERASSLVYKGSRSLKLEKFQSTTEQTVALRKGGRYRFKCFVQGVVRIKVRPVGGETIARTTSENLELFEGGPWSTVAMVFTVGSYDDYIAQIENTRNQPAYIDVCTLYHVDSIPPEETPRPEPTTAPRETGRQILADGSFEDRTGWTLKQGAKYQKQVDYVFEGEDSVRLDAGSTVEQTVALREGGKYRMRCYAIGDIRMEILDGTRSVERSLDRDITQVGDGPWNVLLMDFDIVKYDDFKVRVWNFGTELVYLDECTLYHLDRVPPRTPPPTTTPTATPVPVVGDQLLKNRGFEGSHHWTMTRATYYSNNEEFVRRGERSMRLNGFSSKIRQELDLRGGGTYRLRCYLLGKVRAEIRRAGAVLARSRDGEVAMVGNGPFSLLTMDFEVTKYGTHMLDLASEQSDPSFIDDCTLYSVGEIPPRSQTPNPTPSETTTTTPKPTPSETTTTTPKPTPSVTTTTTPKPTPSETTTITPEPTTSETTTTAPDPTPSETASTGQVVGEQILANSGFETLSDWDFRGDARLQQTVEYVLNGSRSLVLPFYLSGVEQTVRLRAGGKYRLVCFTQGAVRLKAFLGSRLLARSDEANRRNWQGGPWETIRMIFDVSIYADVKVDVYNGRNTEAYVDSCVLYHLNEIPPPEPTVNPTVEPSAGADAGAI